MPLFSPVVTKNIIFNLAQHSWSDEVPDHPFKNANLLLDIVHSNDNVNPILLHTEKDGLIIALSSASHIFKSSKTKHFMSVIAPISIAGTYAFEMKESIRPNDSFSVPDNWITENATDGSILQTSGIPITSAIIFPRNCLHILSDHDFTDYIPIIDLIQFFNANSEIDPVYKQKLINFLIQSDLGISSFPVTLSSTSGKGKDTWSRIHENIIKSFGFDIKDDKSLDNEDDLIVNEDNDSSNSSSSSISKTVQPDEKKRKSDVNPNSSSPLDYKRYIQELHVLTTSLANHAIASNLPTTLPQVISLEDKNSWYKKMAVFVKDLLINLRAGPTNPNPTCLSPELETLLKDTSTKQQAEIYFPASICKIIGTNNFDCMASGSDFENWLKHGELKYNSIAVSDFKKAYGMNFHALGPKKPLNSIIPIQGPTTLKHHIFIPNLFSELEESALNLLAIITLITGKDTDSFAKIGLETLIQFYKKYKTDIKTMSEDRPYLLADIQIQIGNEWNSFLNLASKGNPTSPPDFSTIMDPIMKGRVPHPFLTSDPFKSSSKNDHQSFDPDSKKRPFVRDRDEGSNSKKNEKINSHPQVKMAGDTDRDRLAAFKKSFGGKNTIVNMNLPKVDQNGKVKENGRAVCMKYLLLHKCTFDKCKNTHIKVSNEFISALMTKSNENDLKVVRIYDRYKMNVNQGKHHTPICQLISPEPEQKQEDSFLISTLKAILKSPTRPLNPSPIKFEFTEEAALENAMTISNFDFSIESMLNSSSFTTLHPGSEFRDPNVLRPILQLHKYGPAIYDYLNEGFRFDFDNSNPYSEEDRLLDLEEALEKDINNKSALHHEDIVEKAIEKEVKRGWIFALPLNFARSIKDKIGFIPLGTSKQFTLNSEGKIIEKFRLTQDCSRLRKSGFSINTRCAKEVEDPEINKDCYFGGCLNRILTRILFLRRKYPHIPILMSKHDLDSAYRRLHVFFPHAILACWRWKDKLLCALRALFGGQPNAKKFSNVSDFICDLAQWIADDPTWNPNELQSVLSKNIPPPIFSYGTKASARPLMHDIQCKDINTDVYIDDLITILVLLNMSLLMRAIHAIPLAIDSVFRPIHQEDNSHIERSVILAPDKVIAEGNLSEIKVILGKRIDTITLMISLPIHKGREYIANINDLLTRHEQHQLVKASEIESLIGKLVNVSQIAREGLMFMSRLRYRLKIISKSNQLPHNRLLQNEDKNDLLLWKEIITSCVNKGRHLNTVVETVPEFTCVSDAAESNGLGGWLSFGPAWRFELPDHLIGIFTSNLLETIAAYWTMKLLLSFFHQIRFKSFVDNSATQSWTTRNRFNPSISPAHDHVCRLIGRLMLNSGSSFVISHVQASKNNDGKSHPPRIQHCGTQQSRAPEDARRSRITTSIESANTNASNKKRDSAFNLWIQHVTSSNHDSIFLDGLSAKTKLRTCEAFCDAYRHGELGKKNGIIIQGRTVRNTVSQINQTFLRNDRSPPFLDKNGKMKHSICKLLKSYENEDPERNCQPALPPSFFIQVLKELENMRSIHCDYGIALCELTLLAALFGLRSVEYVHTHDKHPKTEQLRLKDISFQLADITHCLCDAQVVSFIFRNQKNGIRNQKISRPRSNDECIPGFCPVSIASSLYNRVGSYPIPVRNPTINTCMKDGWLHFITYKEIINYQKRVARRLGEAIIGFPPERIGTHSMRVTFTTQLYNAGFSDSIIMAEGRWKSDAYLQYIRLHSTRIGYNVTAAIASNKKPPIIVN